jgi:cellulose 1,4-beta-cellobiosidase
LNPEYIEQVDSSIKLVPRIKEASEVVKKQPTAIWLDNIANIARIAPNMQRAAELATASQPVVIQFVVYNLPGRDCNAFASNGELPSGSINVYKTRYIDVIKGELAKYANPNVRVVLVLEPDSLPNMATNLGNPRCQTAEPEYYEGIAYAMAELTMPNTYMYLDTAHGGWLGWDDNLAKITTIYRRVMDIALNKNPNVKLNGFATNVSNLSPFDAKTTAPAKEATLENVNGELRFQFNACIDEDIFTRKLAERFAVVGLPTRFIVDTSRNGQAGIRTRWGSWCNVKGSGIGSLPQVDPTPLLDAFVWIKPPGESDGIAGPQGVPRLDPFCDPTTYQGIDALAGAPQAGQWFHSQFVMLVDNANPKLA